MSTIHRFKYSSETHLASSLGGLLASFVKELLLDPKSFMTVPVPLHKHRLAERGFNQSLLLARTVSSILETPLDYRSLVRKKDTRSQTGLARKDRKKNIARAFSVISNSAFKGKNVLLVDDVLTTGYTLNECAQTVKQSGALKVICLALARTVPSEEPYL
ncbi:MAG: ComF family protein [Thermodesulfobacteriota bacterium]